MRRYDEAIATGLSLIALDPNQGAAHQRVGQSRVELGRLDEAIESLERAVALAPGNNERLAAHAAQPHYHLTTIYIALGDTAAAVTSFERAWNERDGYLLNRARVDPKLDPLRSEARVQSLLQRMRSE